MKRQDIHIENLEFICDLYKADVDYSPVVYKEFVIILKKKHRIRCKNAYAVYFYYFLGPSTSIIFERYCLSLARSPRFTFPLPSTSAAFILLSAIPAPSAR